MPCENENMGSKFLLYYLGGDNLPLCVDANAIYYKVFASKDLTATFSKIFFLKNSISHTKAQLVSGRGVEKVIFFSF
jgi:hypothetical protein